MRRLLLNARLYEEPNIENYNEYLRELDLCLREGYISHSDAEYLKCVAHKLLREARNKEEEE